MTDVKHAIERVCDRLTKHLGTRKNIVEVVKGSAGPTVIFLFCEQELRIIRFGLEYAKDVI